MCLIKLLRSSVDTQLLERERERKEREGGERAVPAAGVVWCGLVPVAVDVCSNPSNPTTPQPSVGREGCTCTHTLQSPLLLSFF